MASKGPDSVGGLVRFPEPMKDSSGEQLSGSRSFHWSLVDDQIVAVWEDILTLRATRDGRLQSIEPMVGAPHEVFEKTKRGSAAAFLRARRGQHSLHASAVACRGRALACIGDSGAGKSTVAERACRIEGVSLLADDVAAIEAVPGGWQVLPSEEVFWLGATGSSGKAPFKAPRAAGGPALLRWVVCLGFDDSLEALEVRYLRGAEAVATLLPSLIRFDSTPAVWERELDVLGGLFSQAHIVRRMRPRGVQPETVADAVLRLALEDGDESA